MRKFLAAPILVVGIVTLTGTAAFAHDCFNASKPLDKGNALTLTNLTENEDDVLIVDPNPGQLMRAIRGDDILRGTIGLDFDNDGLADASFMSPGRGVLPDGARLNCDGHGIDSFEVCGH